MNKVQLIIVGIVLAVIVIFALVFAGVIPGLQGGEPEAVTAELTLWSFDDSRTEYDEAFARFKELYPKVNITHRQFGSMKEYEDALLEAFASTKGPDIFMLANKSFPRFSNKISAFPAAVLPILSLRNEFPQVVEQDFSVNGVVYALPRAIDTLALAYNKDFLNTAGIPFAPDTWESFKLVVPKLTVRNAAGEITRAGAAIGGSETSVQNAADILSLLMLQTGTTMVNPGFTATTFASEEGVNALSFYTDFADPGSGVYTWDDSMGYSEDAFTQEKVAMVFAYARDIRRIREKNPFLNFEVAPMPQPANAAKAVTYPFYSAYAVSRQSTQKAIAWDFIKFIATDLSLVANHSKNIAASPALRTAINASFGDPTLTIFARQALTARSWPQIDPYAVTNAFSKAIQNVIGGKLTERNALLEAQSEVNKLFPRQGL